MMKFNEFNKVIEGNSNTEEFLNLILDKMIKGIDPSDLEKEFLKSFSNENENIFYDKFKNKIRNSQYLDNLDKGSMFDIIMFNPRYRNIVSTKEVEKIDDNLFYIHSTVDGWQIAKLNKEELISFMVGEIDSLDLNWV